MINMTTQDTFKTIEIGINKSSLAKEIIADLSQETHNVEKLTYSQKELFDILSHAGCLRTVAYKMATIYEE